MCDLWLVKTIGSKNLKQCFKTMNTKKTCPAGGCGVGAVCSNASRNTSSQLCEIALSTRTRILLYFPYFRKSSLFTLIVLVLKVQDLRIKCISHKIAKLLYLQNNCTYNVYKAMALPLSQRSLMYFQNVSFGGVTTNYY